ASELAAASPLTRPVLRLVRPVGGRRDGTRAGVLAAARVLTDEGHDTFSPSAQARGLVSGRSRTVPTTSGGPLPHFELCGTLTRAFVPCRPGGAGRRPAQGVQSLKGLGVQRLRVGTTRSAAAAAGIHGRGR